MEKQYEHLHALKVLSETEFPPVYYFIMGFQLRLELLIVAWTIYQTEKAD